MNLLDTIFNYLTTYIYTIILIHRHHIFSTKYHTYSLSELVTIESYSDVRLLLLLLLPMQGAVVSSLVENATRQEKKTVDVVKLTMVWLWVLSVPKKNFSDFEFEPFWSILVSFGSCWRATVLAQNRAAEINRITFISEMNEKISSRIH